MFNGFSAAINPGPPNTLKLSPVKTCNISYNFQSSSTGLGIAIPASEPVGSPQISYTISSSFFPTLSGNIPGALSYAGILLAGLINSDATNGHTISYRILKNGTSVATGANNISAANVICLNFLDLGQANAPKVGDVWTVNFWCASGNTYLTLDRYALPILPTKIKPVNNSSKLLCNIVLNVGLGTSAPAPSGFTPYLSGGTYNALFFPYITASPTYMCGLNSSGNEIINIPAAFENSTYGLYYTNTDVSAPIGYNLHATQYQYNAAPSISQISWRETNVLYNGQ